MTGEYAEVIRRLNNIYRQTGFRLENFGDSFYDPYLMEEGNSSEEGRVYLSFDHERGEYVGRLGDPYSGTEIREEK
jgi:seryl-tRNA(Sec) selenium transferase